MYKKSDDFDVIYEGAAKLLRYTVSSGENISISVSELLEDKFDDILKNLPPNSPNMRVAFINPESKEGVLIGECMFKKAFDSSSGGRYIKLELHYNDETLDIVKTMEGKIYDTVLMQGEAVEETVVKGEHGELAKLVVLSPLFYQRKTWQMLGTEDNYLDWVRSQPCLVTDKYDIVDSDNRCEAAHCRDLRFGGGTALKPEYMAVPMRSAIHAKQHQEGVVSVWRKGGSRSHSKMRYPIESVEDHAMQWMILGCMHYLSRWCIDTVKEKLNKPSLSLVSQQDWEHFFGEEYFNQTIAEGKYPWEFL